MGVRNPILYFTALFAAGIVIADNCSFLSPQVILIAAIISLLLAIAIHIFIPEKKSLKRILFLSLAGISIFAMGFERYKQSIPSAVHVEGYCLSVVKVTSYPERTEHSWRITAQIERVKDGERWEEISRNKGRVMLYFPPDSQTPHKGEKLMIWSKWQEPQPASDSNHFDYRKYLHHKGIVLSTRIYNNQYRVLEPNKNWIVRWHDNIQKIIQSSALSSQQKGILESLLLGYRSNVDIETQQEFRSAGITHLLCVSGLHVGIIAAILSAILWLLPLGRYYRIAKGLLTIVGVWKFALFTGMAPSTIRASLMLSFLIIGKLISSRTQSLNILAASALLLLIVRPGMLFEVGFQLSYSAVFGILLFYRPLNQLITFPHKGWYWKLQKSIWNLTVLSTVAQISCTPWILYYFHQFAPYFLIANITIIPFASVLLGSGILLIVISWWHWGFSAITWTVSCELKGVHFITSLISQFPNSLIENIHFSLTHLSISITVLVVLGYILNRKR